MTTPHEHKPQKLISQEAIYNKDPGLQAHVRSRNNSFHNQHPKLEKIPQTYFMNSAKQHTYNVKTLDIKNYRHDIPFTWSSRQNDKYITESTIIKLRWSL